MLEVSGGRRKHTSAKNLSSSQHRCSKFHIMRRPQQGAANRVSWAIQGAELGRSREALGLTPKNNTHHPFEQAKRRRPHLQDT